MASARPYIVTLYLEEPSNAILKIRLLTFYSEPLQQTTFLFYPATRTSVDKKPALIQTPQLNNGYGWSSFLTSVRVLKNRADPVILKKLN